MLSELKKSYENFKKDLIYWFTGEFQDENVCYLVFNCNIQDVISNLPNDLQNKILHMEYKR